MRFESSLNVYSWGSAPRRVHPACLMILNSDPDAPIATAGVTHFHSRILRTNFPPLSFLGFLPIGKKEAGADAPAILNIRSVIA